jgi:hypothetical protein
MARRDLIKVPILNKDGKFDLVERSKLWGALHEAWFLLWFHRNRQFVDGEPTGKKSSRKMSACRMTPSKSLLRRRRA